MTKSAVRVLILFTTAVALATPVTFKALDQTGAPIPNVLLIVKSLDGRGEAFRSLTDQSGSVRERVLAPGLYRVIATCPYGICRTNIKEFVVADKPVNLDLKVDIELSPTRDYMVAGPSIKLPLKIVAADDKPAVRADILVRDASAENEHWYKTNENGEALIDVLGSPMTVVVVYRGTVTEKTLSPDSVKQLLAHHEIAIVNLKQSTDDD